MDVLVRATMKDAAKCDTQCELQISVNHQISERKWRWRDTPASTSVSVSWNHPILPLFLQRLFVLSYKQNTSVYVEGISVGCHASHLWYVSSEIQDDKKKNWVGCELTVYGMFISFLSFLRRDCTLCVMLWESSPLGVLREIWCFSFGNLISRYNHCSVVWLKKRESV